MREILFRGKVKWNGNHLFSGQWIIGSYRYDNIKEQHLIWAYEEDNWGNAVINREIEVVPETVGQYTGMTDRDSNKIFEGDTVIIEDDPEQIGVVVWDCEELKWDISARNIRFRMGYYYPKHLEIIGNIYGEVAI